MKSRGKGMGMRASIRKRRELLIFAALTYGALVFTAAASYSADPAATKPWVDPRTFNNNLVAAENYAHTNGKGVCVSTRVMLGANLSMRCPLDIEPGGQIVQGAGKVYTFSVNGQPFKAGLYQVFAGFSRGQVTGLRDPEPELFGFSASQTGVANQSALAVMTGAAMTGSTIHMPPGSYPIAGLWIIDEKLEINAHGCKLNFSTNAPDQGVRITASGVTIKGLEAQGPQAMRLNPSQVGIYAYGANSSHYLTGVVLEDVSVHDWGNYGMELDFAENFSVRHMSIRDIYHAGLGMMSCRDGVVEGGTVANVVADRAVGTNAYGVIVSKHNGSEVAHPISRRITVHGVKVSNIPTWEAFDTHGGEDIVFSDCHARDCRRGFAIGALPASGGGGVAQGPVRCKVLGCASFIDHGPGEIISRTNAQFGMDITGDNASPAMDCVANGNVFDGHGASDGGITGSGTLFIYKTTNLLMVGNIIRNSSLVGVLFRYGNIRATISDLTIDGLSVASGGAAMTLYAGKGPANESCDFKDLKVNVGGTNAGVYAHDANAGVNFLSPSITSGGPAFSGAMRPEQIRR